jgi:dienelactone hydrolase
VGTKACLPYLVDLFCGIYTELFTGTLTSIISSMQKKRFVFPSRLLGIDFLTWFFGVLWILFAVLPLIANANPSVEYLEPRVSGDVPVIKASGIESDSAALLLCTRILSRGYECSFATFKARNGEIATDQDAAIHGAYRGLDPYGIFWSMNHFGSGELDRLGDFMSEIKTLNEREAKLYLLKKDSDNMEVLTSITFERSQLPIAISKINEGSVQGFLYQKLGSDPVGKILSINGCPEGDGSMTGEAYLASKGYLVFQMLYTSDNNTVSNYKCAGELNFHIDALTWLSKRQPQKKAFVLGRSRGAQASLWLGVLKPELIEGIVSFNGSPISTWLAKWYLNGELRPMIGQSLGATNDRFRTRLSDAISFLSNSPSKYSQSEMMEDQIAKLDFKDVLAKSIPTNCTIPTLALLSENDQLIETNSAAKVFQSQCGQQIELVVNSKANHATFIKGWSKMACSKEADKLSTNDKNRTYAKQ